MIKAMITDEKMKPKVGSEDAAGLDLRVPYDIVVKPGEIKKVGTGLKVAIPKGYVGLILPRSSCADIKISLANTAGLIDSDYRGEITVKIENRSSETRLFYKYDRVMQMVVLPHLPPKLIYVDSLDDTERGDKGFGSSGTN